MVLSISSLTIQSLTIHSSTQMMTELGMTPMEPMLVPPAPPAYLQVQLDGRIVGHLAGQLAQPVVERLHAVKAAVLAMQEGRRSATLPTLRVSL